LDSRGALSAAVLPAPLRSALEQAHGLEREAIADVRRAVGTGNREAKLSAQKAAAERGEAVRQAAQRLDREARRAAAVTLSAPDTLAQIQSRLGPDEALVLYALTTNEAAALVLRRSTARVVRLRGAKELRAATDALLEDKRFINPREIERARRLLGVPLALAADVRRVLVSPMEKLAYIPFSVVFPDREVSYIPSGTTHGLLESEDATPGLKVLALGDPDYTTKVDRHGPAVRSGRFANLQPLPRTRKEVAALGDVLLLGKKATETGLQSALDAQTRWRSVHFACHGLVDAERPMLSALALTADKKNDGFLTALEVFRMKIPADLVVMSACETGKGKIYRTEGIVGLTSAIMFAGTPRVICSLWKVDDEATLALMIKFYELWNPKDGSKGMRTAAALKQAQLYVRNHPDHPKWKHPYYWAAWVLWGLAD